MRHLLLLCLLAATLFSPGYAHVLVEEDSAQIGETEIPFLRYRDTTAPNSKGVLVWYEPHYGDFKAQPVARRLAEHGFIVIQPNWFEAFFLPRSYASFGEMDNQVMNDFVVHVKPNQRTPVYLIGASRGAVAALKTQTSQNAQVRGLIALNPSIYKQKPEPFQPVTFVDAAGHCSVPVVILQPKQSTRIWWMNEVEKILASGGAKVRSVFLDNVRDGFWQRPDITQAEVARKAVFHQDIIAAINTLETLNEE